MRHLPQRRTLAEDDEHRSRQRSLEERLRQTEEMEAIGRLAGGIAHDLSNLLLVIRGYSQLLLERVTDGERDYASQIDKAAERAGDFIHQLRAFSRRQVLYPEAVDLNASVRETLGLLSHTLAASVAIEVELAPELGTILVDRSELSKAILNLAINARDAMPDGGLLHIRTARIRVDHGCARLTPGSYAILEVTDSGIGMDEETRRRAFEPFFTTKDDGTGLGLASVYGLTTQSGGDVWLHSEPGLGTTFLLYLPFAHPERERPTPESGRTELELPRASPVGQEVDE